MRGREREEGRGRRGRRGDTEIKTESRKTHSKYSLKSERRNKKGHITTSHYFSGIVNTVIYSTDILSRP